MEPLRDFTEWPRSPLHLAVGVFDGVHLGHRALIARLRDGARAEGALALAATFDPLPIQTLAPGAPASALSDATERVALLTEAGADAVVLFHFDPEFAETPARRFIDRVLAAGEVKRIVVGQDFRFGRDRGGEVTLLRELASPRGTRVEVVPPVEYDGAVVSSTRIRNALLAGDVKGAAALLARPYSVRGRVVSGDRRGRGLGYPTINIGPPPERILPRDGIYATWATVAGKRQGAATSLGVRPTFGAGERTLEAFLLDFSGDLYGAEADIAFVERLRDELRFDSAEALVAQIAIDVERTRKALLADGGGRGQSPRGRGP